MFTVRKRPYSAVEVVEPCNGRGEWEAATDATKTVSAVPQGGPADLEFLVQLPDTCMSKEVHTAVQKAAAGGKATTPVCTFLGVRRKQRSLEGAWTVTVTIEQTPTTIGGKFADEIVAARAHDLLVLLFCTGRAARRTNFQTWTYADELPAFKNLPLVEAIAKVKKRQSLMFSYNESWCQRPAGTSNTAAALDAAAADLRSPHVAAAKAEQQQLRLQANEQRTSCMPAPARCSDSAAPVPQVAAALQSRDTALPQEQQPAQQSSLVRKYYMHGVYKPARLGAGLHLVTAQLENFLGPRLGAHIPDGLDPPMEDKHQNAFLRRFQQVMQRMGMPTGRQQSVFAPVDIGILSETCGNSMRPTRDVQNGQSKRIRVLTRRAPRLSMDENAYPNNL